MKKLDDFVTLQVVIPKSTMEIVTKFCVISGVSVDTFIQGVLSEAEGSLTELIAISEKLSSGEVAVEELEGYSAKFEGIAKAFDSVKLK